MAIDGKQLRGSATAQAPGIHLLATFSARLQGVILAGVTITSGAMFTTPPRIQSG